MCRKKPIRPNHLQFKPFYGTPSGIFSPGWRFADLRLLLCYPLEVLKGVLFILFEEEIVFPMQFNRKNYIRK